MTDRIGADDRPTFGTARPDGALLPATTRRVARHTPEAARRTERRTAESVAHHARHPEAIGQRLRQLGREWDIERVLETSAATLALAGVVLGAAVDRRFLILPAAVTASLLQHALQGWCPPVPFFRRRGVRTAAEIARERAALEARGDFRAVAARGPAEVRAAAPAAALA